VALLAGAAADWDAGGITREVLAPYEEDRPGSALPLRFTAALHRLVLARQAPSLALYYPTVGGTAPPEQAWPAARQALARHLPLVRALVGLPCQTNEVGRAVPLLVGLLHIARRTGAPLRLLEIGASAGLNLLVDCYRYGEAYGPPDSPCRLPDPGLDVDVVAQRRTHLRRPIRVGQVKQLTARPGVWRLSYEPDTSGSAQGVALRVYGPGIHPDGDVLARGGGHGLVRTDQCPTVRAVRAVRA